MIRINCDNLAEADAIGDAINIAQGCAGDMEELSPKNVTIHYGDTLYTSWCEWYEEEYKDSEDDSE